MTTINFKIDYNSVRTINPEMGSEALARKRRYILDCRQYPIRFPARCG